LHPTADNDSSAVKIGKKSAIAGFMRMTDRFTSRRTFLTHPTTPSHTVTPSRNLRSDILSDSPSESKNDVPVQYLKGVGPARAKILDKLGIQTSRQLLEFYPREWQDRRHRFSIREAPMGERVTLIGQISNIRFTTLRKDLGMASADLQDASGRVSIVWFKKVNYRYDVFASLKSNLQTGQTLMVFGVLEFGVEGRQLRVEESAVLTEPGKELSADDAVHLNRIVPLYTIPEGLNERLVRSIIHRALSQAGEVAPVVPGWLVQGRNLPDKAWSLRKIHFPDTLLEKERARELLAFEEFLLLETALAMLRRSVKLRPKSHHYQLSRHLLTPFREALGFTFTNAQKRVIKEIFDDLMGPFPMNRLLQGDVGSGKTLVALSAMLLAVENGGQAALMAPTEILAEQHALTFGKFLKHLPIQCAVLSRRQTAKQRKAALQEIAAGNIHLVIGTHALIQKSVIFKNLMLAVVDEQHRFGVEHRSLLRRKGHAPDVLVMTATPIPRTLALTLYGDLDVSTIDELPPGRTPITTRLAGEDEANAFVLKEAAKGRQAYMVFPLVEESDKVGLKATVQEAETLSKTIFRSLRVGVLHGQLSNVDKESTMERFRRGELDLLMATSIIEVGIDVPNATVMVIQHAERYGLATLHQLRGRVGRGAHASTCLLVADSKSADSQRRLRVMTETQNGFRISEEDLELRGPGEILGAMQHGMPGFKLGHLIHDAALIQTARQAALEILRIDPELKRGDHTPLRKALQGTYAAKWFLGTTG
jgi:ATP-dependent DNA helicase RecG